MDRPSHQIRSSIEPAALRSVAVWELAGVVPIVLAGSVLHFAFDWSGGWRPLALIAAVNESVWEHMKLAFWPALAWAALSTWFRRSACPGYWFAKAIGLLVVPVVISVLYYGYKAILGHNLLALDIGIFVVAILLGQLSTVLILRIALERGPARALGRLLMVLQIGAYSLFTYLPPALPLFEETRSGLYGIPPRPAFLNQHR
jgi:hypothetical protein